MGRLCFSNSKLIVDGISTMLSTNQWRGNCIKITAMGEEACCIEGCEDVWYKAEWAVPWVLSVLITALMAWIIQRLLHTSTSNQPPRHQSRKEGRITTGNQFTRIYRPSRSHSPAQPKPSPKRCPMVIDLTQEPAETEERRTPRAMPPLIPLFPRRDMWRRPVNHTAITAQQQQGRHQLF